MYQLSFVFTTVSVLLFTYLIGLCIHRVYFSGVAHVPGPFLAKVTYWYEIYYDVYLKGQYTFKIKTLHERYGPIVRINPEEVHISDPDFYDVVYAGSSQRRDIWARFRWRFGIPESTISTVGHDHHRLRRSAMSSFFSKAKVRSLQPLIEDIAKKLLLRFEEFRVLEEPMTLSLGFAALTNDVVEEYALGRNDNRVLARDFDSSFHDASVTGTHMGHFNKQFPFILQLMQILPDNLTIMFNSAMATFVKLQRDIETQIQLIVENRKSNIHKESRYQTIFHELLDSDLPEAEKSVSRLWQDGQATIAAGTLTTASALSYTFYCLLIQPGLLRRLRSEIESAMPDPTKIPPLAALEQLPFLTACIKEGLRLSNGVSSRTQRIDPDHSITFIDENKNKGKRYVVPPGTPLSMTGMLIHWDENVFPEPLVFRPDRWLDGETSLDKYLVPFSRGTRQCIGINLAYAEIYLTLAMMFRVYGSAEVRRAGDLGYLELFETEWARDVEIVGDGFIPMNRPESKGIRVMVRR